MSRARPILVAIALTLFAAISFADDKKNASQGLSNVNFTVIRDYSGKPIRNASVILHPVDKDGKQSKGGYQLKTDAEGKTTSEGVPYGKIRIQVIAQGFQTFGDDYDVNEPQMEIEVRLKRPQDQLTIYKKSEDSKTAKPNDNPQQQQPH